MEARTCTRTDRWTDGLKHTPSCTRACKHTNACIDERRLERSNRTDSHKYPHAHVHAHTRMVACLHAHTMHSGTYARTDRHTHTCSYGGKHPSTNMEVRSKKLEVRSKKLEVRNKKCRACIDERTHVRTNIWTHEHAGGQIDGRTDSSIRPHARVHANTRTHALMNADLYDQTFGCRTCTRTDRQTDRQSGWTDSHLRNHARAHAHTRTVACLHAHTMHSGTYARTDRHMHTCSFGGKHPSTNMEVRS